MKSAADLMTKEPCCCTPETSLKDVAEMMVKYDCGEIPVVDALETKRIVGVITDRDICCRALGKGLNPLTLTAAEVMTFPAVTASLSMSAKDCCKIMERHRIRRLPVVDDYEKVCGIISLADIVSKETPFTVEVMREISKPKSVISLQH